MRFMTSQLSISTRLLKISDIEIDHWSQVYLSKKSKQSDYQKVVHYYGNGYKALYIPGKNTHLAMKNNSYSMKKRFEWR